MHIKELMTPDVEMVPPDATLQEAAEKMRQNDLGPLPVLEHDQVVGMVTDRDIAVRAIAEGKDPRTTRVRDVMTQEILACHENDDVEQDASIMADRQVNRLLVLNDERQVVGIISITDVMKAGGSSAAEILRKDNAGGSFAAAAAPQRASQPRGREPEVEELPAQENDPDPEETVELTPAGASHAGAVLQDLPESRDRSEEADADESDAEPRPRAAAAMPPAAADPAATALPPQHAQASPEHRMKLFPFFRSQLLMGSQVKNWQGQELGKIEEFMIDEEEGRIVYAVLSFGGFLGLGNKLFAIPWDMLTFKADERIFLLDIEKEKLENAPGFDKSNWPALDRSDEIHKYYGQSPYWEASSGRAGARRQAL